MAQISISGDTSGTVTLAAPSVSGSSVLTLPAVTGTILTGITPTVTTTIGVGNTTPAASGSGVTFPATDSASTDANTLDDYEEGTWTPVLTVGFTTAGATTLTGTYTKIGRIVFVRASMQAATTFTSAGGNTRVTGMPFTSTTTCPVVFARNDLNYPGTGFFDGTTNGVYNPAYTAGTSAVIFTFFYII